MELALRNKDRRLPAILDKSKDLTVVDAVIAIQIQHLDSSCNQLYSADAFRRGRLVDLVGLSKTGNLVNELITRGYLTALGAHRLIDLIE